MAVLTRVWRSLKDTFAGGKVKASVAEGAVQGVVHSFMTMMFDTVKDSGGTILSSRVEQVKDLNAKRAELLAYIRKLGAQDEEASRNILEDHERQVRCEDGYIPGDETRHVESMVSLYKGLADDPNARDQVFIWLGHLTKEERNARLEFIYDDAWAQRAKRMWHRLTQANEKLDRELAPVNRRVRTSLDNWNRKGGFRV